MRDFNCPNCGQRLTFENSTCLSCNSALGFSLEQMALLVIAEGEASGQPGFVSADEYQLCANLLVAECNWLVPVNNPRLLCPSCVLT
ncbi:MAG: zinc-ribbon domain-containing protein, partial [Mycobacterium sp.]|uniref:zinc-ribbon domain-containing protein n=1 Tax=Mycobacterium sp. TaxID=1785 RepID=UPI001ED41046